VSAHDDLAVRKQLLLAQSALYRAQLRYEVVAMRTRTARGRGWVARGFALFLILRKASSLVSFFRK